MLQSTLEKIETLINQNKLMNNVNPKNVSNLLMHYKKDMWIYPSVLKRELEISVNTAYNILNVLEDASIIERYYELYCFDCQRSTGLFKRTINEIPDEFECDNCQKTLLALENCRVVFMVVAE